MEFMQKAKDEEAKKKKEKKNANHIARNDDEDSVVTTNSELDDQFKRLGVRTENRSEDESSIVSKVSKNVERCDVFCEREPKRVKHTHFTPEIVVAIEDQNGKIVPIRALLDTGTTSTILLRRFIKRGSLKS